MSLANLEGATILGPGSEWFWAMAQFLLVAASIFGIYFQLRAQRASTLFDQTAALGREWVDETFLVHRLAALVELEGRPIESGLPGAALNVGDFFDRIGYLVAERHLRASDVSEMLGAPIGFWWRLLAPYVERSREVAAQPALYARFESLETQMRAFDANAQAAQSPEAFADEVRMAIDELAEELRRLADARDGVFPARRSAAGATSLRPKPRGPVRGAVRATRDADISER